MTQPRTYRFALIAAGALVATTFLFPYLVMFLTSLKPTDELFVEASSLIPRTWRWENYLEVWTSIPLADYLRTSVIVSCLSTALVMVAAVPAAYCTARMRFRGRRGFLALMLITQMVVPSVLIIGIYREFLAFGLIDSLLGLVLVNAAFNLAFAIWILNAYFQTIPIEIEESATIDGASRPRTLLRIVLPLGMPGLVTATIFTFIAAWNEYVVALTLISSPDQLPVTVGVAAFVGRRIVEYQYLFAASLIAVLPVVVLFLAIERRLVGGLTAAGVK